MFNKNSYLKSVYTIDGCSGIYDGEWKNGEPNGQGKFTYNYDRGKYEGEFLNGLKHGHGIEIHPCGTKYIGNFEEG